MKNLLNRLFGKKKTMTTISIVGTGNMARGIGSRALAAGQTVQFLNRDAAKAAELASELGKGATSGSSTEAPEAGIVVLALPFDGAKDYVSANAGALAGKVLIDITNPLNFETFDSLVVPADSSAAEEIAKLVPNAQVVKAFNTTFAGTLAEGKVDGKPLDVFIAGADEARAQVAEFARNAGLRPLEVGGLHHARELEGFQLLVMAMQANPAFESFNWNTGLKILN
ncbi:NADPH-dependent F420 reductase [Arthrobacter sp. H14]|uniref:NADPH-dependent F420 reductase n=1 Tax=Arthrobacter sp. H14 TaxID=1312959 RepID=UPI0020A6D6E6|nr:NADPH-dependent F420 reductase [Arthrobacter sp. H14]